MAAKIRFYLDENVPITVAVQLNRRGIEAATARDLGQLGDTDANHLNRATALGYVLCTHDSDFVEMAAAGVTHGGIVFGQQHRHSVGDWVRFLELVGAVYDVADMVNHVEYV